MRPKKKSRPTPEPPSSKAAYAPESRVSRGRWIYIPISAGFLLPCFWLPRIEAGDLSSHVYNAWLAQLIGSGQIKGLHLIWQSTNVLFDLMLSGLFQLFGPGAAQRISASAAVLVFVWGAFVFARVVAGRKPWHVLPAFAVLGYGWAFHMGFFNFYLSLGLCLWALALLWQPTLPRGIAAGAVLLVAYFAHALPVLWAVGLAVYSLVAERLGIRARYLLTAAAIAAMVCIRLALPAAGAQVVWVPQQFQLISGADQALLFDNKYFAVEGGLLIVWIAWLVTLLRAQGIRSVFSQVACQLWILSAAAVVIMPSAVLLPKEQQALGFIAQRMSLSVAVCLCAVLSAVRPHRIVSGAMLAVLLLFAIFLYSDQRAINSFEARMENTLTALPPGQRVVSAINDPSLRIDLSHVIDRACIGHCYSYANYEPSSAQFRVRVDGVNPYVSASPRDAWQFQTGAYVVKNRDLPLYQLDIAPNGQMGLRTVPPGVQIGTATTALDIHGAPL